MMDNKCARTKNVRCSLIATPNVDNANRRQKERQKLNYKLRVILMQKGIVVFVFANYLDDVLVWNYTMSGFKRGGLKKREWVPFPPVFVS